MIPILPLMVPVLVAAAAAEPKPMPQDPATALCLRNGATVTSETLPNGSVKHVCTFPGGSRIDAQTYFRNKHRTR